MTEEVLGSPEVEATATVEEVVAVHVKLHVASMEGQVVPELKRGTRKKYRSDVR